MNNIIIIFTYETIDVVAIFEQNNGIKNTLFRRTNVHITTSGRTINYPNIYMDFWNLCNSV